MVCYHSFFYCQDTRHSSHVLCVHVFWVFSCIVSSFIGWVLVYYASSCIWCPYVLCVVVYWWSSCIVCHSVLGLLMYYFPCIRCKMSWFNSLPPWSRTDASRRWSPKTQEWIVCSGNSLFRLSHLTRASFPLESLSLEVCPVTSH